MKSYRVNIIAVFALFAAAAVLAGCHKPVAGYGRLEGTVTGPDGKALAGVSVFYGDSAVLTDPSGGYVLDVLPDGTQGVRFVLNGYYSVMELVDIPNGGTARCDVRLEIITAGWAVGAVDSDYGAILYTVNAGASWVRQGSPSTVPCVRLTDVCAVSDRVCWIVGEADTVRRNSVILRTDDGGSSWSNQGGSVSGLRPVSIAAVTAFDGDTAWAVASDTSIVLKTTDGGSSWSVCRDSDRTLGYSGVAVLDGKNVWCCGKSLAGGAVVEYSSDGGRTWISVDVTAADGIPSDICAVPGPVLYMTCSGTAGVLTSLDKGSSWVRMQSTGLDLISLDALDNTQLWASGAGGQLLRTDDGFQTYTDLRPASAEFSGGSIVSVAFLRDWTRGAFAVQSQSGATGSIFYTSDGGSTWTGSSVPFSFSLESLDFVGGSN